MNNAKDIDEMANNGSSGIMLADRRIIRNRSVSDDYYHSSRNPYHKTDRLLRQMYLFNSPFILKYSLEANLDEIIITIIFHIHLLLWLLRYLQQNMNMINNQRIVRNFTNYYIICSTIFSIVFAITRFYVVSLYLFLNFCKDAGCFQNEFRKAAFKSSNHGLIRDRNPAI